MSEIQNHPDAREGETAYEWHDDTIVFQRDCPNCDKGLIYAPVRFCGRCGGSGYLLRHPQRETEFHT